MRCRIIAVLLFSLLLAVPAAADQAIVEGQNVYVPAYSHIYQGPKGRPYQLAVMLSIRNVDLDTSITVAVIDYYDDHGKKLHAFLDKPVTLGPLETYEVNIPANDKTGGSGANFIVNWSAEKAVSAPIIQSVMIGTASQQGISFVCDGVPLESH
ncbi:DUF3124 domain-containing protein [Salidesulfovibrio brasiliensis]|uniref:DUF3124 domain-containing protein n=1 Tax=Salidesulfovibrio brasiliensis TaxID=221711 RepID=UPI0006D12DB1|nr:DUF3124 domain-containing protein [Salidesulfovibrio brasiliensis]